MPTNWIPLCKAEALAEGQMLDFQKEDVRLAVYRVNGEVYATSNVCTHAYVLLTDGWLEGPIIECPLHGAQFDVRTGEVLSEPAEVALKTYAVREQDGEIEVAIEHN